MVIFLINSILLILKKLIIFINDNLSQNGDLGKQTQSFNQAEICLKES